MFGRARQIHILLLAVASLTAPWASADELAARPFTLEAVTDFIDDVSAAKEPVTAEQIKSMMATLRRCGVQRVSWSYYGDGHGGFFHSPKLLDNGGIENIPARTYHELGNPLKVAVEAAHAEGLELYAYYKPYETGLGVVAPEGSLEAINFGRLAHKGGRLTSMTDRFVLDNPHLRIKRRTNDLRSDVATVPVCSLKLIKKDDSPTRIRKENLQIWASRLNHRYQQLEIDFDVVESVERARRDVYDLKNTLVTRKGDPVRVLTLSGFQLEYPYLLVTTNFTKGKSDFENTVMEMLVALDAEGREIPGVFSDGWAIWNLRKSNFRGWGLFFDYGFGRHRRFLDSSNVRGNLGLIAFARGRNEYLTGALCETEPEVRKYWLSCIDEMLEAGVDGIDVRVENHSTHTDYPEDYGFNSAVLKECERRSNVDLATVASVRGDAYTEFLRQAKQRISARGKRMRINLNVDWFRPDPPKGRQLAFPANIRFNWERWVEEDLMDEAILRFFSVPFAKVFQDEVAKKMVASCRKSGIPVTVNKYLWEPEQLHNQVLTVKQDGRFSGFILYETASFLKLGPGPACAVTMEPVGTLKGVLAKP
jgi:hypothetical protein